MSDLELNNEDFRIILLALTALNQNNNERFSNQNIGPGEFDAVKNQISTLYKKIEIIDCMVDSVAIV